MSFYKNTNSLEKRIYDSNRIRSKYPTHVPVIVEVDDKVGKIKKNKFLVPQDVSATHLIYSIRNQIKFNKNDAMILFVGNVLICPSQIMHDVYDNYLSSNKTNGDLFMYVSVKSESTFGNIN
jgi:GABA(A) receptor-associated protein